MMLLDSPFFRFLASKLGEGQVLFLLRLETVDPGTGMVWCCKYFSPRRQILQQEKIISVGKVFTCCESCLVIWSELIWSEFLQIRVTAYDVSDVECPRMSMSVSSILFLFSIIFQQLIVIFSLTITLHGVVEHYTCCSGSIQGTTRRCI